MSGPSPPASEQWQNSLSATRTSTESSRPQTYWPQGAIQALNDVGRPVPQSVGVVGFDDAPVAALNDPPLSTVRSDARATGIALADLTIAQIRGQELPQRHLVIPNEVLWRESA